MSLRRIQKGSLEEIFIDREKEPPSEKDGIPSICYSVSPELPRE